jgi:hypothetical protein
MAEPTKCPGCPHGRTQHSKNGCTWPGCHCKATYMDLSPRKK